MSKLHITSVLDESTHTKKCKQACQSSSFSSCCTDQCIDCCTPQYQVLSVFLNNIVNSQLNYVWELALNYNTGDTHDDIPLLKDRCGNVIAPPNTTSSNVDDNETQTIYSGAYVNSCYIGVGKDGVNGQPVSFVRSTGSSVDYYDTYGKMFDRGPPGVNQPNGDMLVAASAYYFVNEYSYGEYEPGCHSDQVYGWYVNMSTGELQLFTPFEGVPVNATRACLVLNSTPTATTAPTSTQKRQLKVLNKLYKLSKSAIKEINGIPSQTGNIVEVCDCKGDRWLLYINTASSQNGSPLSTCNYQFAIVATKLC